MLSGQNKPVTLAAREFVAKIYEGGESITKMFEHAAFKRGESVVKALEDITLALNEYTAKNVAYAKCVEEERIQKSILNYAMDNFEYDSKAQRAYLHAHFGDEMWRYQCSPRRSGSEDDDDDDDLWGHCVLEREKSSPTVSVQQYKSSS